MVNGWSCTAEAEAVYFPGCILEASFSVQAGIKHAVASSSLYAERREATARRNAPLTV